MTARPRAWLASRTPAARGLIAVLAVVGAAAGVYFAYTAVSSDKAADEARAALARRDFKSAREMLAAARAARPGSGELAFLAARAARQAGDFREAKSLLDECQALGWPGDAVKFERYLLRAQTGEFRAVEPLLLDYAREDPPPADAELAVDVLVPTYLREYELGQVLELLERWTALRPNDAHLWLWKYEAAIRVRARQMAVDALTAAVVADPESVPAHEKLGDHLLELNRPAEAKPQFEWLLARDPGRPRFRFGLARCEQALGNAAAAAKIFAELTEIDPLNHDYLAHRGYSELAAGRPEAALPWLQKAYARGQAGVELLNNLAVCLRACGKPDEAAKMAERMNQVDKDMEELDKVTVAARQNPGDPEPRYQAGVLFARNGQRDEAKRWLESVVRLKPDHAPARRLLAELTYQMMIPPRP